MGQALWALAGGPRPLKRTHPPLLQVCDLQACSPGARRAMARSAALAMAGRARRGRAAAPLWAPRKRQRRGPSLFPHALRLKQPAPNVHASQCLIQPQGPRRQRPCNPNNARRAPPPRCPQAPGAAARPPPARPRPRHARSPLRLRRLREQLPGGFLAARSHHRGDLAQPGGLCQKRIKARLGARAHGLRHDDVVRRVRGDLRVLNRGEAGGTSEGGRARRQQGWGG